MSGGVQGYSARPDLAVDRIAVSLQSLELTLHHGEQALLLLELHLLVYLGTP